MRIPKELLEQTLAGYDALIRDALVGNRRERYKLIADLCDQAEILLDMSADSVEEVDAGQHNIDAMDDYIGAGVIGGRRQGRRRLRRPNQQPMLLGANMGDGNDTTRTMLDTFGAMVGPQAEKSEQDVKTGRSIELRELLETRRKLEDEERVWPTLRRGKKDAPEVFPRKSLLESVVARIGEIEREMAPPKPALASADNGDNADNGDDNDISGHEMTVGS